MISGTEEYDEVFKTCKDMPKKNWDLLYKWNKIIAFIFKHTCPDKFAWF